MDKKETFHNQTGGARLKLVIALAIIAVVGYAGYLYIPVAVDAYYFKDAMQNKVNLGAAQGFDESWLTDQVSKSKAEFHVPDNAQITPGKQKDGRLEVRVQFSRPISTPLFTYNYEFDHTAQSTTFLTPR